MAVGAWDIRLRADTPQRILDQLGYFSHIAVTEAREDIRITGDAVLSEALYVGVLRSVLDDDEGTELSGGGMILWLGDEDDKGAVIETPVTFTGATMASTITTLLAGAAIHAGTLHSVSGTYTGTHQFQSPRSAIDYVTSTMGAEYRVNGDGTLDAGLISDLYPASPRAGIFAKATGTSATLKALPGLASLTSDVQDFTTRVVLLANGTEAAVATGSADIAGGLNPYKDLFGNTVKMTRLISESTTSTGNATVRAQLQLNRFTGLRNAVTLNSTTHDVSGSLAVGEYVWVFDPDAGLYDYNNELQWQGQAINPALLRVTSLQWPVEQGRGVYLRTNAGVWLDLTDYVTYESGQTNVTVGGYDRSLTTTGVESVWERTPTITPDLSVPATPVFTTPFQQATYLSTAAGMTKTQVRIVWARPLNTDGTTIIDGDHFELRYRTTSQGILPATHPQLSAFTHTALNGHLNSAPIPFTTGDWTVINIGWDLLACTVIELTPGMPYEFQIRAVDNANPPNDSAWSASQTVQALADNLPPSEPAPATVAGNRVAVEVRHDLGKGSGGTFNLEQDLNHLEVHAQYEPNYEPIATSIGSGGTMIGKLRAGSAEINGSIPVVGTFPVENTAPLYIKVVAVDQAGNRSRPSTAAQVTALLIDSAHISDLTASKITAGTITSQIVQAGTFATGFTPGTPRVGFDGLGFYALDAAGALYFSVDQTQAYVRGHIIAGTDTGTRIELDPAGQNLYFYPTATSAHYTMRSFFGADPADPANTPGLWLNGTNTAGQVEGAQAIFYEDGWVINMPNAGAATNTGGYADSGRAAMFVGFEDGLNPTAGWDFVATAGGFGVQSKNTNQAGGHLNGDLNNLYLTVRGTTADRQQVHLDANNTKMGFFPGTTSSGWAEFNNATGTAASTQLRLFSSGGFGNMLKMWQDGRGTFFEVRAWDDLSFQGIRASVFEVNSSQKGKTDIADAGLSALARIKAVKVKKYRRKGGAPKAKDAPDPVDPDGPVEIGLLAEEAPPEIVNGDSTTGMGIGLYQMATYMWSGMQELAAENDDLKTRVAALEDAVAKLTKKGP